MSTVYRGIGTYRILSLRGGIYLPNYSYAAVGPMGDSGMGLGVIGVGDE